MKCVFRFGLKFTLVASFFFVGCSRESGFVAWGSLKPEERAFFEQLGELLPTREEIRDGAHELQQRWQRWRSPAK